MKSHRVDKSVSHKTKGRYISSKENDALDSYENLAIAIAEQALFDYENLCLWLINGKYVNKMKALDKLDDYYATREYFDSGLRGTITTGKYALSYQVDAKLMRKGIDAELAHYKAGKLLAEIGQDNARIWFYKKLQRDKWEEEHDVGFNEYAGRGRRWGR